MRPIPRRALVALPAAAALSAPAHAQSAAPEDFAAAERAILGARTATAEGISIDMPMLSENGNAVDLAIKVASPMTAQDHVTAIHILSEKNPVPRVARFDLSPRAGRAEVATRIRLATTQTILVLAETSRGPVLRGGREGPVILGACVDGG